MVVVAIIAIAAGVAMMALRDPSSTQLEREAARLSALLEAARAEARGLGLRVVWRPSTGVDVAINPADPHPTQFEFVGLPKASVLPRHWLNPAVRAEVQGAPLVLLGPEPLIGAQRIVLRLDEQRLALVTDGLGPFTVQDPDAAAATLPR